MNSVFLLTQPTSDFDHFLEELKEKDQEVDDE